MIKTPSHETCPFCEYLSGAARCAFLTRGPLLSSFLNRTQFERGALLLVPRYETSVPWQRFHSSDFPHTPIDELEALAVRIRSAL